MSKCCCFVLSSFEIVHHSFLFAFFSDLISKLKDSIMSETTAPELYNLDKINVHFLNPSSKTLPLVISPRFDDSLEFISTWLTENRPWVHNQMLQYGAVLIRGFQIDSAVDFEKATLALDPNLCDKYRGTSPR